MRFWQSGFAPQALACGVHGELAFAADAFTQSAQTGMREPPSHEAASPALESVPASDMPPELLPLEPPEVPDELPEEPPELPPELEPLELPLAPEELPDPWHPMQAP